ncbi:MAG: YdcF family protein [Leptolyngbyaceae cyanobacterium T60_A2020_046]|nr:YdcF family protein [Leptolyngbyaceae cyanobacterium T60_A2020_046]
MFLFLSKLLPLLVYPLGLAIALLIAALILLSRNRTRWAMGTIAIALVLLLGSSNAWVATRLMQSLEWQHLSPSPVPRGDAIVVLGGSTRPADYPRPWIDVMESGDRVVHGAQLFRENRAPWLIMSGGRITWKDGGPPESSDMAALAIALGVPRDRILEDPTSLNTYQNAVNVKAILEAQNLRRVLLVTSASHMPRSLAIFRKQGIDAIPAPTDFLVSARTIAEISGSREAVMLSLLPQAAHLETVTRALKEYLGLWVYRLRGWL